MGYRYRLLKEGFGAFISGGGRGVCVERGFSFLFRFPFSDGGAGMDEKRKDVFLFFILFLTHESVIRKKIKDIV